MEFTEEQKSKAKACKTLEEFKALAESEGLKFSDEQAEEYFNATRVGELSDDDLDAVAGGKGWKPIYRVGQTVGFWFNSFSLSGVIREINTKSKSYIVRRETEWGSDTFDVKECDILYGE